MEILIGTYALRKLRKHFTGVDAGFNHDIDYLIDDELMPPPIKGIDFIQFKTLPIKQQEMLLLYKSKTDRSLSIIIDDEDVANPYTLLTTYLGRLMRLGWNYKKHLPDYQKINELYLYLDDTDKEFLNKYIIGKLYPNDWLFSNTNNYLSRINYLPSEYVICNEFAIMFYYEQFLHEHYEYNSLDIDINNENVSTNILGSHVSSTFNNEQYNTFTLHTEWNKLKRDYHIEKISSLLEKDIDDNIKQKLIQIQSEFNIE